LHLKKNAANEAAFAVTIPLQRPLKPLYYKCNCGCRPQFKIMIRRNGSIHANTNLFYGVRPIMPTYLAAERMQYLFTNQNPYTL